MGECAGESVSGGVNRWMGESRGDDSRGETRVGGSRRRVGYAHVLQRVVAEREKISRELRRVMDACGSLVPTTSAARDGMPYARHTPG